MGEPVECMMTVDELLKTDKLFQVMCDLTGSATNIPLVSLRGRAHAHKNEKLLFPKPVNPTAYILTSPEFIEATKQGYKCYKIHKVILFSDKRTTVLREYVLTNLRGKFTAEKGLNQEDLDIANEYHTRLFGDMWKPIALSEYNAQQQTSILQANAQQPEWDVEKERAIRTSAQVQTRTCTRFNI
jgi:hypothetical protein